MDRRDAIDITRLGLDGRARNFNLLGARQVTSKGRQHGAADRAENDDQPWRCLPHEQPQKSGDCKRKIGSAGTDRVWTVASSTSSSAAVCTENLNADEPHVTRCFRSAEQDARAAHPCQTIDAFYHPERSKW